MVKERMDLLELLRKGGMDGDVDFLRVLVEGIMDAEVSARTGADLAGGGSESAGRGDHGCGGVCEDRC